MTNKTGRGRGPRTEYRDVESLRLHPDHEIFGPADEKLVDELAEDIEIRGQQQPIEITEGGEIITGRHRWLVFRKLGKLKILCRVRVDLEARGARAIQEQLILDNIKRREVSPLVKVRALAQLRKSMPRRRKGDGELREELGRELGVSGRTVDRWMKVLKTPSEVQSAFERGQLSLVEACRVAGLPPEKQRAVAAAINSGSAPRDALNAICGKKPAKPRGHCSQPHDRPLLGQLVQVVGLMKQTQSFVDALPQNQLQVLRSAIDRLDEIYQAAVENATS